MSNSTFCDDQWWPQTDAKQAAEAPEIIYLVPFGQPIREPMWQGGSCPETIWSTNPYANTNAGNIEYIRTDVLIEKADEFIGSLFHPDDTELKEVLLERFHKYLKEKLL